jgi:hypothetical protein
MVQEFQRKGVLFTQLLPNTAEPSIKFINHGFGEPVVTSQTRKSSLTS